jgi:RNA 2',3'-cyclic 3'-phosphodiesterase
MPRANPRPPQSRLFYAAFVPPELHASVAALQGQVKSGWKLTPGAQLHVTLAFLGEGKDLEMRQLLEVGRAVAASQPAFAATLRGTGFHPLDGSPRVWFVKAEAPALNALAKGLQAGLNLETTERFQAHVTLARKKDRGMKPPTATLDLTFPVTQFALVRSYLEREGSRFKTLEKFHLPPPAESKSE